MPDDGTLEYQHRIEPQPVGTLYLLKIQQRADRSEGVTLRSKRRPLSIFPRPISGSAISRLSSILLEKA